MKRYLKHLVLATIVCIIGYLSYNIFKKINYKTSIEQRIKNIPKFSFLTLENEDFFKNNLHKDTYKVFVYFNSECKYCQSEASQISQYLDKFKNTQLIFVSFEPIDNIKQFAIDYHLYEKENVLFLQDKKLEFAEIFDANNIPFILLYSKDNKLIEKYKGATKVKNILKHIN